MTISRTKFVIIFLVSAFAFQIITNLLLVPVNGEWFPGTGRPPGVRVPSKTLDSCIDDELQRRIVIGLQPRVLEMEQPFIR